ncbi:MAG TPA: DoxX family protein [Xanthobacteraceae bacterium]|nr:DoxX family protein [Xanthobacteraceae bacterium]
MPSTTILVLETAAPVLEALLRVIVGLALVPHGLRMTFGFFAGTGQPASSLALLAAQLDRDGYRPGRLWAPLIAATELIAGPMLAFGLFTRIAAVPVVIFLVVTCRERWAKGGWFWNTLGVEYTLMWTIAAAYFLAKGGEMYSLDYVFHQ